MKEKYNKDIPGWLSQRDLQILSTIASFVPDNGNILEIGSFVGRSTSALFHGKKSSVNLSVVDTFKVNDAYPPAICNSNTMDGSVDLIAKVKELAETSGSWHEGFKHCLGADVYNQLDVNVMLSENYVPTHKFDLVFVDAGHTVDAVLKDIVKFIKSDTLIVGDDFSPKFTGVSEALAVVRRIEARHTIIFEYSKLWMLIPLKGYWKEFFKSNNPVSLFSV